MITKKKRFLFIVEGESREMDIFNNFADVFFNDKSEVVTLPVPAGMNIYMFYDILKKDNFETDLVEVLKENSAKAKQILENFNRNSFSEVYLFFDFDAHANNLRNKSNVSVLQEMLNVFNNETELGKLYISYPMVEAVRDHVADSCGVVSGSCIRNRADFGQYKKDSSKNTKNNKISSYDFLKWMVLTCNYVYRSACLFRVNKLEREKFLETVTPNLIFDKQISIYEKSDDIFILSCLPEFLIDYSIIYWDLSIKNRKKPILKNGCGMKPNRLSKTSKK